MVGGYAVDHLSDEHRLAHASPTEQTDLATLQVRGEEVDDLHPGLEHLGLGLQRVERRGRTMDLPAVGALTGCRVIEALAGHAEHVAEGAVAYRHADASAGVAHRGAPGQAISRLHGNGPHPAVADLLGHLGDDSDGVAVDLDVELEGRVDLREFALGELRVDHRPSDADDAAFGESCVGHDCSWLFFDVSDWVVLVQASTPTATGCSMSFWLFALSSEPSASAPLTISMISVVMAS